MTNSAYLIDSKLYQKIQSYENLVNSSGGSSGDVSRIEWNESVGGAFCISLHSSSSIEATKNMLDTMLESIEIPYGFTEIADGAFHSMPSLKKITIPQTITTIGTGACSNCNSLESVVIPRTVTTIKTGMPVFMGCTSLKKVEIASKVIQSNMFVGCPIEDIDIQEGVVEIQSGIIPQAQISKLTLPSTIEIIKGGAFGGLTALTEIEIMSNSAMIEAEESGGAFAGCTNVERIIVHAPENSIEGAPWGATNAEVIWLG